MRILILLVLLFAFFAVSSWLGTVGRLVPALDDRILRNPHNLKHGDVIRIRWLKARPYRLRFACLILGCAVTAFSAAALYYLLLKTGLRGYAFTAGCAAAVLIYTAGRIVSIRTVPDAFKAENQIRFLSFSSLPAVFIVGIFEPLTVPFHWAATEILRIIKARKPREMTEDEFLASLETGEAQGAIRDEENEMVAGILSLDDLKVSEVMTPRVDLVGLDIDESDEIWMKGLRTVFFRHVPVYKDSMDNIVKMLDLARYLQNPAHDRNAAMHDPLLVSESSNIEKVLAEMRKKKVRCAIALDEYGGTAGLITRGDILEEILDGVSESRNVLPSAPVISLPDGNWLVDGVASLEDINDETGLKLESENSDRIAGWVMERRGGTPHLGEIIEDQGCRAIVARVRRNRILQIRLAKKAGGVK